MMNDDQKPQQAGGVRSGRTNGFFPSSLRAISSYLRVVSSGASNVARSAASVASSIVDRVDDASSDQLSARCHFAGWTPNWVVLREHYKVIWAGLDKLEGEGEVTRQVLLLGFRLGFQVWDVEDSHNVHDLVSRHDGPVSFMQMLPNPIASKRSAEKFANSRPLLAVCADGFFAGGSNVQDGLTTPYNGSTSNFHGQSNGNYLPTTVQFYSMRSQSYVHALKFRSVVYCVRCSSRIVAVSQSTQIHCFDAVTLEREYTILTNPIIVSCPGSGGVGYGPLAVGSRWLAYSGSSVTISNSAHVNPQDLTTSANFPGFSSNGSLVAHYAKESSKQLASGIVSLGDMGYKKLSRYYSELQSDSNSSSRSVNSGWKGNGTINGHSADADNIGMVIVRDIVSKNVVTQMRAHKSPISALRFDPSGTILVTASVQGHNINVYKIMPCHSEAADAGPSNVHLYRLQRGYTNAIIQDISFSDDSNWIMISSSRGTSHLFAMNPQGGSVNIQALDCSLPTQNNGLSSITNQGVLYPNSSALQMHKKQSLCAAGPPITLSVVSRIRNGMNGWRGTVSGAAAAATGKMGSLSGAIASSFCNCKSSGIYIDEKHSKTKYHLLVFSSSGSMIQYALQMLNGRDSAIVSGLNPAYELHPQADARLAVEAIQKWNICQRLSLREREDNVDIYGDNGIPDGNKIYPEESKEDTISSPLKNEVVKANSSSEEDRHLYISQAELQMHQAQTPLWAKSEIYFHSMVKEATIIDEAAAAGGEFEIERIPTRMVQARSKHLIPVFDYLQTPKAQQPRPYALNGRSNEQLLHQSSGMSENGKISDYTTNSTELDNGIQVPGLDDRLLPTKTRGYVNKNNSPKPNTQIVNNRLEHLSVEGQLKFVNSDREGLLMGNHIED